MPTAVSASSRKPSGAAPRKSQRVTSSSVKAAAAAAQAATAPTSSSSTSRAKKRKAAEPPVEEEEEEADNSALNHAIASHFTDAQHSLASHRKHIASLAKVHLKAAADGTKGERAFARAFFGCLDTVLDSRSGLTNADRILKFAASYTAYIQLQLQKKAQEGGDGEESESEVENEASRFIAALIKHLLKGLLSHAKLVRLRCIQTVVLLIENLASLDDDLYTAIQEALLQRIRDKEANVRAQAIVGLSKMAGSEGADEDEDDDLDGGSTAQEVQELLLDIVQHDPSAETRRAALFNLNPSPATLPIILTRLHDVDATNRRCVYLGSLALIAESEHTARAAAAEVDLASALAIGPKLSTKLAEEVVRTGLGDREESVQRAAKKLISRWCEVDGNDLRRFLSRFPPLHLDALAASTLPSATPVPAHSASLALTSLYIARPELIANPSPYLDASSDEFWNALSPRTAFLASHFASFCARFEKEQPNLVPGAGGLARRLEDALPLVTALAFRIQAVFGAVCRLVQELEWGDSNDLPADLAELGSPANEEVDGSAALGPFEAQSSILFSLLSLALHADYADETGRRKMFNLLRDMISHPLLPAGVVPRAMDVLRKLSAGERDFMRIIVEIVQDDEDDDGVEEDEDAEEWSPKKARARRLELERLQREKSTAEEQARRATMDARRLLIVRSMLERVISTLHENTAVHGLIPQLIAPAVKSKDALVREEGLVCLSLCALLDKNLAVDVFGLFVSQVQPKLDEDGDLIEMDDESRHIRVRATQIVFDLLLVHGLRFICGGAAAAANGRRRRKKISAPGASASAANDDDQYYLDDDDDEVAAGVEGQDWEWVDEADENGVGPDGLTAEQRTTNAANEMTTFLLSLLEDDELSIQAIAAEGMAKLMLAGMVDASEQAIRSLVLVYMSPETVENQQLRQCLSYFIPLYALSEHANQRMMAKIFLPVLKVLTELYLEKDDDQAMVTPSQVAMQLADWTDPEKALYPGRRDWDVQVDIAIDIIKALFKNHEKEERKVMAQVLGKMFLPESLSEEKSIQLMLLCTKLREMNDFEDAVSRNAFKRFEQTVAKAYPEAAQKVEDSDDPYSLAPDLFKGWLPNA
ncbi:chromosome condensation complex Condensin, subunit G [Tilletia horrida]|nr:chromosome condensation complex Condensin, subunit G [Tilletia horrida]